MFEGKSVLYVDHGNGTLTGELADGTLIFRATINPTVVDANNHPQYSFELLNTLGRLGIEGAETSYTVISGGNISNLDLSFGGYLVDSMTAVDGSGATTTVNTNNNWIGLGGNWFNPGETLFMSFTDVSGNAGQVRGMDLLVEGQGSAPYTLNWTVTAAIDYSGNTITYSGSVSGAGNADVPFSIPLSGGALYFTDLAVSAPAGSGEFRIALAGISGNDYFSDIPLALDYTLTDADGDTASGLIDVTLMSGNAAPFIGTSTASATVSEEGLVQRPDGYVRHTGRLHQRNRDDRKHGHFRPGRHHADRDAVLAGNATYADLGWRGRHLDRRRHQHAGRQRRWSRGRADSHH